MFEQNDPILLVRIQGYLHCHQQRSHLPKHQKQSIHPPKRILYHRRLLESIHLEMINETMGIMLA